MDRLRPPASLACTARLELGLHGVPQPLVVEETLDASYRADGDVLVPELPVGKVHDVLLGDGVDDALNLAGAGAAAGGDELAANVLGNGGGAVEGQEDGSLELGLGALRLGLADVGGETHPLADGEVDEIVDALLLVGDEVDTPKTGVAVAGGEAHEAVGQVVAVDETAELAALVGSVAHGLVVVADDGLSDESGVVVVVVPADTLNSNGDVGSGDLVVTDADIRADEVGLLLGQEVGLVVGALGGQVGEVLLGELDELLVGHTTGANENHAVSGVVVLDVVGELGAGDVADVLARAENSAAEGLVLESGGVQVVEDDLLELLLDLLGLAEDDVALTLNGRLLELGVLENVGENVDALGDIGVEGLGEVDGVLARGVGVQVATHVLNLELELLLRPVGGALEGKVLEEVSSAVVLVRLGPGTGVDPHADSRGLGPWRVISSDCQAILEGGRLGLARRRRGKTSRQRSGPGERRPVAQALREVQS